MNEAFLCEMILKNHERTKRAPFINLEINISFFLAMYPILFRVFETTNGQATQDHLGHSDDLLRKTFLVEVGRHF